MKKILLFLLAMTLVVSNLIAKPVDQATARKAGAGFAQVIFSTGAKTDDMRLVVTTDSYFVFNIGAAGFVIVSADDSFRPIIGYSDEGAFPIENPSPEMMYYLNSLSQGRQAALRASIQADEQVSGEWLALLNGERQPVRGERGSFYLVKTKWNQGDPYNKFCPKAEGEGRAYAGCVATAMSQVMNYWRYPTHGYGQHSYSYAQYGELSADFSAAVYDFDLMPNSISNMSPVENIDAIAFFMYHCGIAVDMMYGPDGSGAYSYDVPEAVLKYFGYTNGCRLYNRNNYSLKEFQAILRDQFDMGWPCYYSGQDTGGGGGHAFVCDGYDDNDMFHFNWGWSGSGDGFFVIDGLDVSGYAFNSDQAVVANFVPAEVFANTPQSPDCFTAVPNGDSDFSVTLSWTNPTATLSGRPLETMDQIVIMRSGKVIQTFDNPTPGEAMSFLDVARLPITVDYTIYAVSHECNGRQAHANGISLGPTCLWTVNLTSGNENGWGGGAMSIFNASGVKVAEVTAERGEVSYPVEVPQGKVTFRWTAPADSLEVGIAVLDADEQPVFSYTGPSNGMPEGIFFETVNTCGGEGSLKSPSNLRAEVLGEDVVLTWDGIRDPGYGYNVYRDGLFYTMATDTTSYTDAGMAQGYHSYFITAFCVEGETDPSNTVCASDNDDNAPRNMDFEFVGSRVKLTWERPVDDEELAGYIVYRKKVGEDYKRIKICSSGTLSYTDNFLVASGERYRYKVIAASRRDYSESAPARSLQNPDLLYVEVNWSHLPSGLTLEDQDGQALLQWEPAWLAETYNVYRNGELLAEGITELQYTDAPNGEPSYYQVKGVLNGVESSPSNKVYYARYAVGETVGAQSMLFPNPTNGFVTVQAEGLREIVVYNVTGQQTMRCVANGDALNMDLSGLGAGVYYFQIGTDRGHQVQKVVLMR